MLKPVPPQIATFAIESTTVPGAEQVDVAATGARIGLSEGR